PHTCISSEPKPTSSHSAHRAGTARVSPRWWTFQCPDAVLTADSARSEGVEQQVGEVIADLLCRQFPAGAVPVGQMVHRAEEEIDDDLGGFVRTELRRALPFLAETSEPCAVQSGRASGRGSV